MAKLLCFLIFLLYSQLFITCSVSSSSPALCRKDQSKALLKFKSTFSIDSSASTLCVYAGIKSYPKTKSWKEGTDCCKWDGVKCETDTGNVIGLDLTCSRLQGPIYSNSSLFLLSHLQNLNLAHNDFQQSKLLAEFGSLVSLTHLNFSNSNFISQVPLQLSHLSRLVSLDLSFLNRVSLESSVWETLLQKLTQLREVALDGAGMLSISPTTFANLPSSLTILTLSQCIDLKGEFPESIISLPNLQKLVLSSNPGIVSNFSRSTWSNSLRHLDIRDTKISGHLPNSIGNLKSLEFLDLSGCRFSGSIPASIGNLKEMTYLSLFSNNFIGTIPHSLANLQQLFFLDLSVNHLTGKLPNMFGQMSKLRVLTLMSNHLTGNIPSSICSLNALELLNLSNNSFTGSIPKCLGNFKRLFSLELSYNHLVGPIPTGKRFDYFQFHNESYIGNPGLCGFPLTKKC